MPHIVTIFLGLFIAVGLTLGGFGVRALWRDRAASNWPQATGRITGSQVVDTSDSDGNSYKPGIRYHYAVDGKEFDGERISFGIDKMSSAGNFAARYTNKYPVGKVVRVFYQPTQPGVSVLETGLTKHSFVRIAFGLGFAFFGLWFWLVSWLMNG